MGITHNGIHGEWYARLRLYTLVAICRVHGKGEVYHVRTERFVKDMRLCEIGIDTHVRVSLHKNECSHSDVRSDERANTYTQFTNHAVVKRIDLFLAVLCLLDDVLSPWQESFATLCKVDFVRGTNK